MEQNVYYSSIEELSKRIRRLEISPVEIVEVCLKRIEELNLKINAFITVMAEQAREQAKVADAELKAGMWRGFLHGVPVGVKDFYDTAGIKTTAAFEGFRDRMPAKDAVSVVKLKEAGAIIIGKMNMHQLGTGTTGLESFFGPVRNPWNHGNIPGGSSSGSAAAVASGLCFATVDTDAIGSCRLPAACCGVDGFKGTYGLISPKGILDGTEPPDEFIVWMSHPAITARSIEDVALMLDVLAERIDQNMNQNFALTLTQQKNLRIGVADNFKADPEVMEAFGKAVEIIYRFNNPMSHVKVPFIDLTRGINNIESDRRAITGKTFKDIDVLLLPTTTTTVPMVEDVGSNELGLSADNTAFANYYGLPALSVPCGFDTAGLPLGLQIVGKPWDDATVLRMGYEFQIKTEFGRKHPIL